MRWRWRCSARRGRCLGAGRCKTIWRWFARSLRSIRIQRWRWRQMGCFGLLPSSWPAAPSSCDGDSCFCLRFFFLLAWLLFPSLCSFGCYFLRFVPSSVVVSSDAVQVRPRRLRLPAVVTFASKALHASSSFCFCSTSLLRRRRHQEAAAFWRRLLFRRDLCRRAFVWA